MNIVIFGKPGAGKGVQAKILAKKFGLYYFSTGELFREQMRKNTELGRKVRAIMNSPDLVSDDIVNQVALQEMKRRNYDGILFDGYPRTIGQAEFLDERIKIDHYILLDVSDEEAVRRIQLRQKIDSRTETNSLKRIRGRVDVYRELTLPVIRRYEGKLNVVNGERSVKEIANELERICQQ